MGLAAGSDTTVRDADRVYEELRRRILSLDLTPGAIFDEARIVGELGVSRTPVREAVIRLVSEGLLRRDGRQIRVSSFEVGQLRPFFEANRLLSRSLHRLAAIRRTPAQVEKIRTEMLAFERSVREGTDVIMNEANYRFHREIARAADSGVLEQTYSDLLLDGMRLSRQCFQAGDNSIVLLEAHIALIVADHRALFAAIEQQKPDEADNVASRHSDLFRDRVARQLLGPPNSTSIVNLADL
ncbi:GntR family transcriptional regulator [Bradyrhizobium centrosematis]|uniref:GntR family transcriptional regulator n=1 Tax=Bradyrhizobium centrosematis TaxID=1300039 RepID=UPI003890E50D